MKMKMKYETPFVEKVTFDYREQVVASSGCTVQIFLNGTGCANSPEENVQRIPIGNAL